MTSGQIGSKMNTQKLLKCTTPGGAWGPHRSPAPRPSARDFLFPIFVPQFFSKSFAPRSLLGARGLSKWACLHASRTTSACVFETCAGFFDCVVAISRFECVTNSFHRECVQQHRNKCHELRGNAWGERYGEEESARRRRKRKTRLSARRKNNRAPEPTFPCEKFENIKHCRTFHP